MKSAEEPLEGATPCFDVLPGQCSHGVTDDELLVDHDVLAHRINCGGAERATKEVYRVSQVCPSPLLIRLRPEDGGDSVSGDGSVAALYGGVCQ